MGQIINLVGKRFGKLVVISWAGLDKTSRSIWNCRCDCGQFAITCASSMKAGHKTSCGCLAHSGEFKITHGKTESKIYKIWTSMKTRCYNTNDESYLRYGKRGIFICDRWLDFQNFYADMGDPPPSHSIERRDNNGPYCPENCEWATILTQSNNKRTNRFFTYNGETKTPAQWSRQLGINLGTLYGRLETWPVEKALSTPVNHNLSRPRTIRR